MVAVLEESTPDPELSKTIRVPSATVLPLASLTLACIWLVLFPSALMLAGLAETVEYWAAGGPATNVTVISSLTSVPTVAVTVASLTKSGLVSVTVVFPSCVVLLV